MYFIAGAIGWFLGAIVMWLWMHYNKLIRSEGEWRKAKNHHLPLPMYGTCRECTKQITDWGSGKVVVNSDGQFHTACWDSYYMRLLEARIKKNTS